MSNIKATTLAALAITGFLGISQAQASRQANALTKKEVKALLATARTPADHQELASLYEQKAIGLETEAAEHERDAGKYRANPTIFEMKMPMHPRTAAHCAYFADRDRKLAATARIEAKIHAEMVRTSAVPGGTALGE